MIGALVGTPLGGVLSDRIGRRPVMIVGLLGSGIAAIAFGLASGAWPIAVLIVAWGVFASLFDPAAGAYIADVVGPALRHRGYGIKRLVNNAAFALGVPLGALLIFVASIRASFVAPGIAVRSLRRDRGRGSSREPDTTAKRPQSTGSISGGLSRSGAHDARSRVVPELRALLALRRPHSPFS